MIIEYPTGFYKSVLPLKPSDGGNVTYTISNQKPPRTDLIFHKIPDGIVNKKRDPRTITDSVRRSSQGALIYTFTNAFKTITGNNARTYEVGQIIEFGDVSQVNAQPMLVQNSDYIRHDLNSYDYTQIGLEDDDVLMIRQSSEITLERLQAQLNNIRIERYNAEEIIKVEQKRINDINRNIAALEVINATSDVSGIITKLNIKLNQSISTRDNAILSANDAATRATAVSDQIFTVSSVVK